MSDGKRKQGERLSSRQIFKGRAVQLDVDRVRLPNDKEADLEVIHHPGATAIVPLLPDGDVLMIRQYRYTTGGWLLEIPAGTLNSGEDPEDCARRETEEEVGHRPADLRPLGWVWTSPGFLDEKIWLYLATGLEQTKQSMDEDEVLEIERVPFREAVDKALKGEIHDVKSALALLRAAQYV